MILCRALSLRGLNGDFTGVALPACFAQVKVGRGMRGDYDFGRYNLAMKHNVVLQPTRREQYLFWAAMFCFAFPACRTFSAYDQKWHFNLLTFSLTTLSMLVLWRWAFRSEFLRADKDGIEIRNFFGKRLLKYEDIVRYEAIFHSPSNDVRSRNFNLQRRTTDFVFRNQDGATTKKTLSCGSEEEHRAMDLFIACQLKKRAT